MVTAYFSAKIGVLVKWPLTVKPAEQVSANGSVSIVLFTLFSYNYSFTVAINDHGKVCIACQSISAHWWEIGVRLGLRKQTLAIIQAKSLATNFGNSEACMSKVIKKWLKRDVREGTDRPSWRTLCLTLSHVDHPLAEGIAMEHGCKHINLTGIVCH